MAQLGDLIDGTTPNMRTMGSPWCAVVHVCCVERGAPGREYSLTKRGFRGGLGVDGIGWGFRAECRDVRGRAELLGAADRTGLQGSGARTRAVQGADLSHDRYRPNHC